MRSGILALMAAYSGQTAVIRRGDAMAPIAGAKPGGERGRAHHRSQQRLPGNPAATSALTTGVLEQDFQEDIRDEALPECEHQG